MCRPIPQVTEQYTVAGKKRLSDLGAAWRRPPPMELQESSVNPGISLCESLPSGFQVRQLSLRCPHPIHNLSKLMGSPSWTGVDLSLLFLVPCLGYIDIHSCLPRKSHTNMAIPSFYMGSGIQIQVLILFNEFLSEPSLQKYTLDNRGVEYQITA